MLREHVNDIRVRWCPKVRRGSEYDPVTYLETPEQARKLLHHLQHELQKAKKDRNRELVQEIEQILARVESLSKRFFRWEQNMGRSLEADDIREIKKLPLVF
jgi:hypothetical protein